MSSFRNPVGPQPSVVYWRRRLLVGLGLLAFIVIIVLIVVRPGANTPTGQPNPGSTTIPTTPGAATGDAVECAPADITVEAITDSSSYAPDQTPMLSLTVTNNGSAVCTMEAGSDVQEYSITSGEELIWSSKDCQENPVAVTAPLEPGVAVASTPIPWDRTRSDPATCDEERDPVTAAGASYHLSVIVDGIESAETKQFLLN